jgi:HD domain
MGQPPEDAIRSCLLATGLARQMELGERDVGDVYYATLLQHVGCTAYAHETAALFGGNDIAVRAGGARIYFGDQREGVPFLLFELGKGATPLVRAQAVITAIRKGQKIDEELFRSNCEVAVRMSQRLGLGAGVQRGLNEIYERWDGKGNPRKLVGDMALPARFAQERPHRPALTPSTAAEQLSSEAAQGRLDAEAIRAVLEAAGHPLTRTRLVWPAGLSDREVQVLRLVARLLEPGDRASALDLTEDRRPSRPPHPRTGRRGGPV